MPTIKVQTTKPEPHKVGDRVERVGKGTEKIPSEWKYGTVIAVEMGKDNYDKPAAGYRVRLDGELPHEKPDWFHHKELKASPEPAKELGKGKLGLEGTKRIEEIYGKVVENISNNSIDIANFNTLFEALPKSVKEKVFRRSRPSKTEPTSKSVVGQTVPKKQGDNNPIKGRGTRYKSGRPAKERQNEEQRKQNKKQATPVKIENIIKEEKRILCPFCDASIRDQKQLIIEDSVIYHKACQEKGSIAIPEAILNRLPAYPLEEQLEIEQASKEEKPEKETRTYTITGKPDQLDMLEKLLRWVDTCCAIGHSGEAKLSVDGDGAAKLKIDGLKSTKEKMPEPSAKGPELTVGIG